MEDPRNKVVFVTCSNFEREEHPHKWDGNTEICIPVELSHSVMVHNFIMKMRARDRAQGAYTK